MLLRDILAGGADDIRNVADMIVAARPDVILLLDVDFDAGGATLRALAQLLAQRGLDLPHHFSAMPNAGLQTDFDLDGDGRMRGPGDAQGFGSYAGQGGMALLSRLPIDAGATRDFSGFLWRDLPDALSDPRTTGSEVQRLSSVGHWDVALNLPDRGLVSVLAFHATPPVFDGPEDRNGRRNHDEAAFWLAYLDGHLSQAPRGGPLVLLGDSNMDIADSDGLSAAMAALLNGRHLADPLPRSAASTMAALAEGGANAAHRGDPSLDTANWEDGPGRPGNLRVDYVLPSRDWVVVDAGILWASELEGAASDSQPLRPHHGLVWVDLILNR